MTREGKGCMVVLGLIGVMLAFLIMPAVIGDHRVRKAVGVETFRAVDATISDSMWIGISDYQTAPLDNGTAVLVKGLAAYWVQGDTVYAANGHAMTWSPGIPVSPPGIGFYEIDAAIEARN